VCRVPSNQVQRLLFAAAAIPIAIGVVYWGGLPLALLVGLIGGLGAAELVSLARKQGLEPLGGLAISLSVVVPLTVWLGYGGSVIVFWGLDWTAAIPSPWFGLAGATLLVLTATLALRSPDRRPLGAAAVTVLAPIYCGMLPSFLLGIRYATGPNRSWPATWAVFFPLAITWICDTAAMYAGKTIGGPKLSPVVSPGKTRSGAVAGFLGGIVAAVVYNRVALAPSGFTVSDLQAAGVGAALSVIAQVGDLAESLFKREVGVKDSSGLIPGHGGVLDRFDSLYFVVPVAAMLYRVLGVV